MYHGRLLGVRACMGVDCRELSHTAGRHQSTYAFNPCIAIGGVSWDCVSALILDFQSLATDLRAIRCNFQPILALQKI